MTIHLCVRRTVAVVAIAAAALVVPAVANAAPAPAPAASPADFLATLDAANAALTALGVTPFLYPTAALDCSALPSAPLGLVPAVAGAAPGPYRIPGVPAIPGVDLNLAEKGQTLYAFAPAGVIDDAATKAGMQVAWFNVDTFKYGVADMGGFGETILSTLLARVPVELRGLATGILTPVVSAIPSAGVRLAPVDTGAGTVVAAVFGQVEHDGKTCAFLPTVGISQAR